MPVSYAFRKGKASVTLHDIVEPESLAIVQKMLNEGEVIHIGLGNIDLELLSLLDLTNVRSISISNVPCYDLGFLASVKKLESLRLSYGSQPKLGKNIRLDTIPSNESLTSLALESVKGLKNLPQFPNLKVLALDEINENLNFLSFCPALKDLFIAGSSMQGFNQILHCKNLVRLRMIQDRKVDFPGIVADGAVNSSLKILEISHCRDLVNFDFLKQFPALKYMDIESCRNILSFEGIEKCKNLDVINISLCWVKDRNLKYLLHINKVLLGMVYSKEEIENFANEFKGEVYYINRVEKGYLDYADFCAKVYSGDIDDVPGIWGAVWNRPQPTIALVIDLDYTLFVGDPCWPNIEIASCLTGNTNKGVKRDIWIMLTFVQKSIAKKLMMFLVYEVLYETDRNQLSP